ncbi:hypothetical protein BDW66DRAFT_135094 [Aspergillus desertorum]
MHNNHHFTISRLNHGNTRTHFGATLLCAVLWCRYPLIFHSLFFFFLAFAYLLLPLFLYKVSRFL